MKMAGTNTLLRTIERLEQSARDARVIDARQAPRQSLRGEAELHPIDRNRIDRAPIDIALRDISRTGLGFVTTEDLELDSIWRCCFLRNGHVVAQQALAIRHCTQVDRGVYLAGAQFVLDSAALMLLDVEW